MMAQAWIINCPECDFELEISADTVIIECGQALADCSCSNCGHQFQASEDYLLWLGFEGPLPIEV